MQLKRVAVLVAGMALGGIGAWPAGAQAPGGLGAATGDVVAALTRQYGAPDQRRQCWKARTPPRQGQSGITACLQVAQNWRVETAAGPQLFVLLAGNGPQDCHACAGVIGLFSFVQANGRWTVAAKLPATEDGAYGEPTGAAAFQVLQFGPATWGWIQKTGYFAMGEGTESYMVWLPRRGGIVEAGNLPAGYDNSGACDEEPQTGSGHECRRLSATLQVDRSGGNGDAWSLRMEVTGMHGARQVRAGFTVPFDPVRFRYSPPKALEEFIS
ncbi:conserved exported protein of unknown function [Rhodovastum atsumiense]|uniref:Lipoprotein n=1 Tax=Rhodovastum atsumiense TaxID=504468 RepID=A0A5M6IWS2_9PROT|nr:hypothetical protein [Rhodovastum atsumiense]KAA5612784.1 hypothetical protein F1189_08595 [Rhodovastum atsumiense]CAH2602644.1 conserved exported protein of unknown function [Rhodovastum atsumiense]